MGPYGCTLSGEVREDSLKNSYQYEVRRGERWLTSHLLQVHTAGGLQGPAGDPHGSCHRDVQAGEKPGETGAGTQWC